MDTLVSVIIPTFKRPDTLSRSINSVLKQNYPNVEIIVVDDNFPDSEERLKTEVVMRQYEQNTNVVYIKHPQNKNGSAARNTGLRQSHGEFVMFLDDDDEFLPEKVSRQVETMKNRDDSWGASYTGFEKRFKNKTTHSTNHREGNLLVEALMRNLFLAAGSNLMIRRSVCDEIGGFNESFPRNQDLEFLVRILQKYKLAYCDYRGLIVHAHYGLVIDFESVTKQFLKNFTPYISNLDNADQGRIYRMIDLQIFRDRLSRKQFKDAFQMLKSKKIRLGDSIRYIAYLLKRYLFSTIESFNL